jgi:hypothetical protein
MKATKDVVGAVIEWASQLELVEVTYKPVTILATGEQYLLPLDLYKQHEEELSDSSKYYVAPWQTTKQVLLPRK